MENYSSKTAFGTPSPAQTAQKLGAEVKSDAKGLVEHATEAAKQLGDHASSALDDLKSAGEGVVNEYGAKLDRTKHQLQDAARRLEKYSDQNTALVAGGALLVGVLLGHVLTRRSDS